MGALCKQFLISILILFFLTSGQAWAVFVDLNTFSEQPGASVNISSDGLSAAFTEDLFLSPVSLSNSSFAIPSDAANLIFDYELVVPVGNEDYFDFYLGNTSMPLFSAGGYADPAAGTTPLVWSDSYTADLTPYAGSSIDIIFSFMYGWNDWAIDSVLTISNLQVTQKLLVPEPGTFLLMGLGIFVVLRIRRLA